MPKWNCTYAYDIPCYRDFVVEAESEEAAKKVIRQALRAGDFSSVTGEPSWGDVCDDRVFVSGEVSEEDAAGQDTMAELTGASSPPAHSSMNPSIHQSIGA